MDSNKIRNIKVQNMGGGFEHHFRAMTFYFDGSVALYSDYKYLTTLIKGERI